jgi:hypothetical protein
MSFIAKLFMPKMPSLPAITLPGRQSTILTSAKGLNELSEEEYEQKTLLG